MTDDWVPRIPDQCTNCGNAFVQFEACPNIKHECVDCCGCPDY